MAPALPSIFSTPSSATRQVKKATSRLLMGPDWMINMHICDSINTDPCGMGNGRIHGPKKPSDKRLRCELILEGRNMQVREKVLGLLQSWQESFDGPNGKYPQYYYTYAELKRSGVRFPQMQRNAELIVSSLTPTTNHLQVGYGMPSNTIERLDEVLASEMGHSSVMELLMTMLQAVKPNDNMVGKDEVIMDLANQCRVNQKKVLQLINSTENDDLLGEALTIYDNLRVALAKYEALASGTPLPPGSSDCQPTTSSASSPAPSDAYQAQDKEENEDGFSDLAKRHSMLKSTALEEVSPNLIDLSTSTTVTTSLEAPSPVDNSALTLFDPSVTITSPKKTEATIDLFSLSFQQTNRLKHLKSHLF
ncbi:hypothetical protein HPP92_019068 [Vanilla planifolia]|uniref:Uncharacterized protein n=1 Tax=Vanilla planifolia TaxID=51239 RepID=A0A835Q9Z3_VANPL|nr:hypothetical protein HPP92_019068 [Vanilla planifolia]